MKNHILGHMAHLTNYKSVDEFSFGLPAPKKQHRDILLITKAQPIA